MNVFSFMVGLGASLGLLRTALTAPPRRAARRVQAGFFVLLGCLLGARLAFALERCSFFQNHVEQVLQFWRGGLSLGGAIAGAIFTLLAMAAFLYTSPLRLAGKLSPLFPPLSASIWIGCWYSGCAYGAPTTAWWGIPVINETGAVAFYQPIQPLAAFSILLLGWLLEKNTPNLNTEQIGSLLAAFNGLHLALFSMLRGDPAPAWQQVRLDTWAALILTILSLPALCYTFRQMVLPIFKKNHSTPHSGKKIPPP